MTTTEALASSQYNTDLFEGILEAANKAGNKALEGTSFGMFIDRASGKKCFNANPGEELYQSAVEAADAAAYGFYSENQ